MDDGSRRMLENGPGEHVQVRERGTPENGPAARLPGPDGAPAEAKPPAGCVERRLNCKERNILVGAARDYAREKGEHADFKNQMRLQRLIKTIRFEESIDYLSALEDHAEETVREWRSKRARRSMWLEWRAGLMEEDAVKKRFPGLSLDEEPEQVGTRPPELTPEEQRGPEEAFYLPSKLDAWVQDALRGAKWNPLLAEFVSELNEKFGIKDEE